VALSQNDVLRALELVKLPASGQSLAASGRVGDILIDGGKVIFAIGIDATEANAMEPVRKAAESAVGGIPGVTQVLVGLTADKAPGRPPSQAAEARRQAHGQPGPGGPVPKAAGIPGVKQIIAVASGKGGVGKSTTTANLAVGLATLGLKVGVLDADIYGPSVPKIFGITGKPRLVSGRTLAPMEAYGLKIMSIGFLIDEETPMIWRGPMVISAITQMLREVAWGDLDVLVVDMPPGTGDAQLTMAQQTPARRRRHRLDAAGPRAARCPPWRRHVQEGRGADPRHRREHELFHLPGMRPPLRHLRPWRGAARGGAPPCALPRRDSARHADPRDLRWRPPDRGERPRQPPRQGLCRPGAAGEGRPVRTGPGRAADRDRVRPAGSEAKLAVPG
jgi:Mrp family chromosome partitioning ATPase